MLWKMLYKMKAFNGWVLRSGDDGNIIYDLLYCNILQSENFPCVGVVKKSVKHTIFFYHL